MNTYDTEEVIFEDCKLFRDVAHPRSLSRAAQLNGISQSAATQHIQELEKRLGVELLDRTTRPLGLTAAGKLYADLCRDVLRREEDFIGVAGRIERRDRKARSAWRPFIPSGFRKCRGCARNLRALCPDAQLHVEYLRPDKVYEAVLGDQADIGFISYPEHRRDLTVIPWREERMMVAAHPSHPFAGRAMLLHPPN